MIADAANALIARLRSGGLQVGDGSVSGLDRPACAVHVLPGPAQRIDLEAAQSRRMLLVTVVMVAESAASYRWLQDRVEMLLLDHVLQVDGWRCTVAERLSSVPTSDPLSEFSPSLWEHSDTFRIFADPV